MSDELKRCPFCGRGAAGVIDEREEFVEQWGEDGWGQEAMVEHLGRRSFKAVVCDVHKGGCGAASSWHMTDADAIAAWNARSDFALQAASDRRAEGARTADLEELLREMHECLVEHQRSGEAVSQVAVDFYARKLRKRGIEIESEVES